MKSILVFGAGKSATVLIDYLKKTIEEQGWALVVADSNLQAAKEKTGNQPGAKAVEVNIGNEAERRALVQQADLVISLMPPVLHHLLAADCLQFNKHFLTASYVDENMQKLAAEIKQKNLLFLCEMGLDPGIDHMSAMQLVNKIKQQGGVITSFKSHCGGLTAPESDDNPWRYKVSWNPRNIVLAGKAGARYKENGIETTKTYQQLFDFTNRVDVPGLRSYSFYPNRDSLSYIPLYGLQQASTFIRTTLRHPEFCFGWKNVVDLHLTSEEKVYDTDGMPLKTFFKTHFENNGFAEWFRDMLAGTLKTTKLLMHSLERLMEIALSEDEEVRKEMMVVDEKGNLCNLTLEDVKNTASEAAAAHMYTTKLVMEQLMFLGMNDETLINKGLCSAADVMQFILETKLALQPHDKDMIVMLHEFEYLLHNTPRSLRSSLVVKGKNAVHTAMAKTVGLPLGIAAKLILQGIITATGLHIPTAPSIYEPVLQELALHDILFIEYED
ncbi:saccharopine dehydrogenase C-terminal domain-containing protein [Foetidibacter luteolus]|uniref:saccharopine dehydrogenase C-terminal domain-containing protein n=1 Tax=Foetidibacter luteolus TaxID=2608880 RepID=UPI00129B32C7|nr:saccharopine dehydrogenase C-terminal domain-containing protein [Foetidibacter luteolus]